MIYWTTWILSLLVTTSNGVVTAFKIEKKYYYLHTISAQLRSEGWQYVELTGIFSGFHTPNEVPTHKNQFRYFCHTIEKIKMKQIQEEYFKVEEQFQATTAQTQGKTPGPNPNFSQGSQEYKKKVVLKDDPSPKHGMNTRSHSSPPFISDGLIPPTPFQPNLKKILDALSVDGDEEKGVSPTARGRPLANQPTQPNTQNNMPTWAAAVAAAAAVASKSPTPSSATAIDMPMRGALPHTPYAEESVLHRPSTPMSTAEPIIRMGTGIPTGKMEP